MKLELCLLSGMWLRWSPSTNLGLWLRLTTIYRPILILPTLSKFLEKIVYKQLMTHLERHSLLFEYQFGFSPNRSTKLAVTYFTDLIRKEADNGKATGAVFIDLLGSLSRRVFETRTVTGSELFSLLPCSHTTTFTLLSIFSPLETSSIKFWETILSWREKCSLPVAVHVLKTRVLKLPIKGIRHHQSFRSIM